MTEISKRLKVNLKNIRRPIKGVLPKRITRDVYDLEIPLRVFSRIKYDCNVSVESNMIVMYTMLEKIKI